MQCQSPAVYLTTTSCRLTTIAMTGHWFWTYAPKTYGNSHPEPWQEGRLRNFEDQLLRAFKVDLDFLLKRLIWALFLRVVLLCVYNTLHYYWPVSAAVPESKHHTPQWCQAAWARRWVPLLNRSFKGWCVLCHVYSCPLFQLESAFTGQILEWIKWKCNCS